MIFDCLYAFLWSYQVLETQIHSDQATRQALVKKDQQVVEMREIVNSRSSLVMMLCQRWGLCLSCQSCEVASITDWSLCQRYDQMFSTAVVIWKDVLYRTHTALWVLSDWVLFSLHKPSIGYSVYNTQFYNLRHSTYLVFSSTKQFEEEPYDLSSTNPVVCCSMTQGAQQALRRTMEIYSNTTRFALACNTSSKIIEPIQSRCAVVRYTRLSDKDILSRLIHVCREEKVSINPLTSSCTGVNNKLKKPKKGVRKRDWTCLHMWLLNTQL